MTPVQCLPDSSEARLCHQVPGLVNCLHIIVTIHRSICCSDLARTRHWIWLESAKLVRHIQLYTVLSTVVQHTEYRCTVILIACVTFKVQFQKSMKRIIFWNKEKEKYMSRVSVIQVVPGGRGGSGSGDSEEGGGAGNSEKGAAGQWRAVRSINDRESHIKGSRRKIRLRNQIRGQ